MIPQMTDPMGRHWIQPRREAIEVDAKDARMTQATFDALSEYSTTMPTGVYPGKMWRRLDGQFVRDHRGAYVRNPDSSKVKWLLVWYGDENAEHQCPIEFRNVVILPAAPSAQESNQQGATK